MNARRAGLAVVLLAFCLPLFVGLGRGDLHGDEAGHAFSVDRILETGDWLVPKSSPHDDQPFLEKPPLKFWLVALPIRLGVLPHDEFGLRFWDAVFGSLAFLYVFAIGRRLAGTVCGVVSVLLLFAFYPLVFDHGLRSNNMEAPLLLCYCGGIYHFMRAIESRAVWRHAVATAIWFTLGFMTKFVAAIFLPFLLLLAARCFEPYRLSVARNWRAWGAACAVAAMLIAPWFAFATYRFGAEVWRVMLGEHVIERMTTSLNTEHIRPWPYYWVTIYKTFSYAGALALVSYGIVVLAVQAVRRQWADAALVLLWAFLPLALISMGTSKLIHYLYPYVPPFALAGGYLAALIVMLAPAPIERIGWPRAAMAGAALLLAGLAAATALLGEVRLPVAGHVIFRNAGVFRPIAAALFAGCVALGGRRFSQAAAVCAALMFLPVPAYAENLARLASSPSTLRDMRDCMLAEQKLGGGAGLYVDLPGTELQHHTYYYFRRLGAWVRADSDKPVDVSAVAASIRQGRPLLFSDARFSALVRAWHTDPATASVKLPPVLHVEATTLVLPGVYSTCHPSAPTR